MLHHRSLFQQPPAVLTLATPLEACNSSPRSPFLPRDCVSPCALAAFLWKCSHSHGLTSQLCIASCSCGVPPATLASSWALLGIVYCLVLSQHPSGNARTLTRKQTLNRQPSSCRCRAAIVVGLPLLLGCHHCPIPLGYLRMPYLSSSGYEHPILIPSI